MNERIKKIVRKHVLANAVQFGKVNEKAVLGKVLAELPEMRKNINEIRSEIAKIAKDVESLPPEQRKKELDKTGWVKVEKKERTGLPPLPNAEKGKVVTRFPPFPSGALHIGNMKPAVISYEYAKMYNGKFVVRIEDTDPDKIFDGAVELIKKDLEVMGLKYDKFYLCSSHFEKQYSLIRYLLRNGKAYVCTCKAVKKEGKNAVSKKACMHRDNDVELNLELFEKMFALNQGDAVVRLRTDVHDPNPALRDPVLARIKDGVNPLTGKKHKVYPSYNFNSAVEDYISGVTHIFRGAEHAFNTEIQKKIFEALDWKKFPTTINFGFMYIEGEEKVHKRYIREGLRQGKFSGWDDPRLGQYGLIRALIRRGIMPEAIKNMIISFGVNPQTIRFSWDRLYSENRKVIDKTSERYFVVAEPVEIELDKTEKKIVKAPKLPGSEKFRKIQVSKKLFVEKSDFEKFKGKEIRLMHFCNIILGKKATVVADNLDARKIHWVPYDCVDAKVIMPDGREIKAVAEPEISKVNAGQIIQGERFGFMRVDKKKPLVCYFAHK